LFKLPQLIKPLDLGGIQGLCDNDSTLNSIWFDDFHPHCQSVLLFCHTTTTNNSTSKTMMMIDNN